MRVCCLTEYIARKTHNHTADIVKQVGKAGLRRQYALASVNHCLSFEQVSEELITFAQISEGSFDCVANCNYEVPRFLAKGRLYQRLIVDVMGKRDVMDVFYEVFTSFLSDAISNYNSALYYNGRTFLKVCYEEGKIVA